jgi:hypothetical protein
MPTIYDESTRRAILERFAKLNPDSIPRWGRMNAPQMMQHVIDGVRMATGEFVIPPKNSPVKWPPLRWLVIHGPFPWPKGVPTAPELLAPPRGDWSHLQESLANALAHIPDRMTAEHPAFGKLSPRDWGVLVWRHLDHHLRQFGV